MARAVSRKCWRIKATKNSKHNLPIALNELDRQFNTKHPNPAYVGDMTYIPTAEGWLYLAVVIDLYSRHVVGWSMADNMTTQLVNDALIMALWKRKPDKGLLWHTDRGSQYAADSHRKLLKQHGIEQKHEPKSQLLGQRRLRELLSHPKNRMREP